MTNLKGAARFLPGCPTEKLHQQACQLGGTTAAFTYDLPIRDTTFTPYDGVARPLIETTKSSSLNFQAAALTIFDIFRTISDSFK